MFENGIKILEKIHEKYMKRMSSYVDG